MNWKEFFVLDLRKIILLFVLLILSLTITYSGNECSPYSEYSEGVACTDNKGFPFAYYSSYQSMASIDRPIITSYNYYALIPDIVFWYIISAIIIFGYNKLKIQKNERQRNK